MGLHVKLLTYTPEPEKVIAAAAKLCYSKSDVEDIEKNLTEEKITSFLDMLTEIGHESPIEHAVFTFGVSGVSRSLLAQLTRHRMASYSVKSQRYVNEGGFEYVIPPEIASDEEAMRYDEESYHRLSQILIEKHKKALMANGLCEKEAFKKAEKQAIEDARFVLPNACETKLVFTMNARSLYNFFAHRCCNRAQWEIRALANEMLREVTKVAPSLFKKAGPPCLFGTCPEGKMTCGKMKEVREYYHSLREEV